MPKAVLLQWQNELYEKFNLNVPIYDGSCLRWKQIPGQQQSVEREVKRDEWQSERMVLASSYLMRRAERQREVLEADAWDLVVLDEAHHARRKGAGTTSEKGPNALLGLMRKLKDRCASMLLLSATPMQVHPVELWDLMNLLGLPPDWARDDSTLEHYFSLSAGGSNPSESEWEYLARLFRDTEGHLGMLSEEAFVALLPEVPKLARKKVLSALRSESAIPRKTLSAEHRRVALRLLQAASPLRKRMVRNTRELLRRYAREGRLALPIAHRDPQDIAVPMSEAESALYQAVEDYISDTYNAASKDKRSAVGFVMTIYRRRLASSFKALEKTLVKRLARMDAVEEEDASQDETRDEPETDEERARLAQEAGNLEERDRIGTLLKQIAQLGSNDSKARRLKAELERCFGEGGYQAAIVFTQYTDTMEYLREYLAGQMAAVSIASYSGSSGCAWRDTGGNWNACSKEEIKRRLRLGQVRLLICTDAAGEGLNMQFAGVVANYDLPWNPMKVEQRIGRIDRLGQKHERIRVLNFAYKDTVEEDVFFTVGSRINLFQGIVGRLQPILSRLPRQIEDVTLCGRETREAARQRFIADLEQQVTDAEKSGFDLDATATGSLELPELPEAALTLADLEAILLRPEACPPGCEARALDVGSFGVTTPGARELRVTTSAEVFDYQADNQQLFSPGGEAFAAFSEVDEPQGAADGVAWLVQEGPSRRFVIQTEYGPVEVKTAGQLIQALNQIGQPTCCPVTPSPDTVVRQIA